MPLGDNGAGDGDRPYERMLVLGLSRGLPRPEIRVDGDAP